MFFRLKTLNKGERQALLSQQQTGLFYAVWICPTVLMLCTAAFYFYLAVWGEDITGGIYDPQHYQWLTYWIVAGGVFLFLLYKVTCMEIVKNPVGWKLKEIILIAGFCTVIPWAGGVIGLGAMIPEANMRLDFSEARPVQAFVLGGRCDRYRNHRSDCTSDIYEIESKSRHRIAGYWAQGDVLCIKKKRGLFGMAWASDVVQCNSNREVGRLKQKYVHELK